MFLVLIVASLVPVGLSRTTRIFQFYVFANVSANIMYRIREEFISSVLKKDGA